MLDAMRAQFGLDLGYPRPSMLQRRVRRRMSLMSVAPLAEYVERLGSDPKVLSPRRRDGNRRSRRSSSRLVVEDDTLDAKSVERALGPEYVISHARDLAAATGFLERNHYDVVVLDLSLPDGHGLELVQHVRTVLRIDVPVVVVTGHGDGISPGAMTATLSGFVAKSELSGDTLRSVVDTAIARSGGYGQRPG